MMLYDLYNSMFNICNIDDNGNEYMDMSIAYSSFSDGWSESFINTQPMDMSVGSIFDIKAKYVNGINNK